MYFFEEEITFFQILQARITERSNQRAKKQHFTANSQCGN